MNIKEIIIHPIPALGNIMAAAATEVDWAGAADAQEKAVKKQVLTMD